MELEDFANRLCERIIAYMESAEKPGKLVDYTPAESLAKTTDVHLPLEGHGADAIFDDIDEFLRHCVKTNRPEFMNPLWGGLSPAGFAGEVITALTNTSMYTYELAPFATLIEQAILKRMGELVGFSGGAGTLATGGSNGNMLGMLCAREVAFPSSTHRGIDGTKMAAFVSSESHYSVLMSANVIGIGHRNLFKIACDEDGRMRPDALLDEIQRARSEGLTPFCIVSTAGTTVRGAFDPLVEIGKIAHQEGLSAKGLQCSCANSRVRIRSNRSPPAGAVATKPRALPRGSFRSERNKTATWCHKELCEAMSINHMSPGTAWPPRIISSAISKSAPSGS